jgi:hypothetical protein
LGQALSNVDDRNSIAKQALQLWAAHDYSGAEKWAIDSNIDPSIVAEALLSFQTRKDSNAYANQMAALSGIADSKQRSRAYFIIYSQWSSVDQQAAEQWLENSPVSPIDKSMLKLVHK